MKTKRKSTAFALFLYGLIAGLLIGISALALYLFYDHLQSAGKVETNPFNGSGAVDFDGVTKIDPPLDILDFTLLNQQGAATSLYDLRGKHVLLTFGFTHCPDVCPLTLNDYQRTQSLLGAAAERMHFVFVSVDGPRDTPDALRHYFSFRGLDNIIALTGEPSTVRDFGRPFGLSFEISQEEVPAGYLINHTVGSFLLDPQGRWIMRYQFGVPPERIAADLQSLLSA